MKMEVIGWHDLLTAYIKQHYAKKNVLVIFQDDADSPGEYENLMNQLDELGLAPPFQFRGSGFLIIEMHEMTAMKLIKYHNKGFIRMELFSDGVCVHENL